VHNVSEKFTEYEAKFTESTQQQESGRSNETTNDKCY